MLSKCKVFPTHFLQDCAAPDSQFGLDHVKSVKLAMLPSWWIYVLQCRSSCKIYLELQRHALSSGRGLVERVCNCIQHHLNALWRVFSMMFTIGLMSCMSVVNPSLGHSMNWKNIWETCKDKCRTFTNNPTVIRYLDFLSFYSGVIRMGQWLQFHQFHPSIFRKVYCTNWFLQFSFEFCWKQR